MQKEQMKLLISLVASTATLLSRCESKKGDAERPTRDLAMASSSERVVIAPMALPDAGADAASEFTFENWRAGAITGSVQRSLLSPLGL